MANAIRLAEPLMHPIDGRTGPSSGEPQDLPRIFATFWDSAARR